ncbi:MAG TPA: T9SS type A sorting domain-containing protein, partial [Flavobacterium alvei]|nr:T9SS type A sorting domain-containing protein [Flavobacterium alvei]
NGNFNIEIDENLIAAKATIYNLLGQKIKDFDLKTTTTTEFLNKGIYLLEIEKDGSKTTQKLIVN